MYITFGDFNLYHEAWRGPGASRALIKKSEKLLIAMQKLQMKQIVPVSTATYRESKGENTIDLIFLTP